MKLRQLAREGLEVERKMLFRFRMVHSHTKIAASFFIFVIYRNMAAIILTPNFTLLTA